MHLWAWNRDFVDCVWPNASFWGYPFLDLGFGNLYVCVCVLVFQAWELFRISFRFLVFDRAISVFSEGFLSAVARKKEEKISNTTEEHFFKKEKHVCVLVRVRVCDQFAVLLE